MAALRPPPLTGRGKPELMLHQAGTHRSPAAKPSSKNAPHVAAAGCCPGWVSSAFIGTPLSASAVSAAAACTSCGVYVVSCPLLSSPARPTASCRPRRPASAVGARRLFGTDGYGATSMEAIAREPPAWPRAPSMQPSGPSGRSCRSSASAGSKNGRRQRTGWARCSARPNPRPAPARRSALAARAVLSRIRRRADLRERRPDESPETRALLRGPSWPGMDAMIAWLQGQLAVPLAQAGRCTGRWPPVYRELVHESRLAARGLRALGGRHPPAQPDPQATRPRPEPPVLLRTGTTRKGHLRVAAPSASLARTRAATYPGGRRTAWCSLSVEGHFSRQPALPER